MPELPEVETIRRTLEPAVAGRRIVEVVFYWHRTCAGDLDETVDALRGQNIESLERYGKYLLFHLRKRHDQSMLIIHLRMTGNLLLNGTEGRFTRAAMIMDNGVRVIYQDIRKFGRWQWSSALPLRLAELGPEPLEISRDEFVERLKARRTQLKALLLDQEFVRGLGNIYADESLFRAGLHPKSLASSVSSRKAGLLHKVVQDVLQEAIAAGGTTISNYVDSQGSQGYFQLQTNVYGKTGKPCVVCGTALCRIIVASRSTHFCPRCQRR